MHSLLSVFFSWPFCQLRCITNELEDFLWPLTNGTSTEYTLHTATNERLRSSLGWLQFLRNINSDFRNRSQKHRLSPMTVNTICITQNTLYKDKNVIMNCFIDITKSTFIQNTILIMKHTYIKFHIAHK